MGPQHGIVGSEAFDFSARRLPPAHGALKSYGPPRRRALMPRWFVPSFIGSAVLLLMAIGKTVSAGGI